MFTTIHKCGKLKQQLLSSFPSPCFQRRNRSSGLKYFWFKTIPNEENRSRILRRNWDKRLQSFPPCYSQSPPLTDLLPHPLSKTGLKLVCNVNIEYGNLKSENSQDNAQKPQRNRTFMNFASGITLLLTLKDFVPITSKNTASVYTGGGERWRKERILDEKE